MPRFFLFRTPLNNVHPNFRMYKYVFRVLVILPRLGERARREFKVNNDSAPTSAYRQAGKLEVGWRFSFCFLLQSSSPITMLFVPKLGRSLVQIISLGRAEESLGQSWTCCLFVFPSLIRWLISSGHIIPSPNLCLFSILLKYYYVAVLHIVGMARLSWVVANRDNICSTLTGSLLWHGDDSSF